MKFQGLKNFDAFPRAEDHLLQKTKSGALGMFSTLSYQYNLFSILCMIDSSR